MRIGYDEDRFDKDRFRENEGRMPMLQRRPLSRQGLRRTGLAHDIRRDWILYAMLLLPLAYYVIFKYIPMYGVTIAFKDYNLFKGMSASPWAGLKHFNKLFQNNEFYRVVGNTLTLNMLDLLVGFPAPILLAILLNELRSKRFMRFSQTVLYLPYFISWVVIGGMTLQLFAPESGLINIVIRNMGGSSIPFLTDNGSWIATYVGIGIWQGAGWGSIIYIAAISGINGELYEAAMVDGAGRFRRIIHVTLPCISSTIVMMLVLRLGAIMSIGFEKPYLIGNNMVRQVSDVISTYVYRIGLESSNFSVATAVGLMQSVIGMAMLLISNAIANRVGDNGIF